MKSKFTKIATFVTAACLTFTTVALAACNPDDPGTLPTEPPAGSPEKDGYNITVLYPDGSPVKGTDSGDRYASVSAELTDENGERVDPNAKANLNEAGIAQISYTVPGEYYIKLNDIPPGYAFDNTSVQTTRDKAYYTVSIELGAPTPYTVTLIKPDNTPLSDVTVKLMDGTTEVASAVTNEQGVATTPTIVRGAYNVVLDLPEGLGYRPAVTGVGLTNIYMNLVKKSNLPFDEEHLLEGEALDEWDDTLNWYYPNKENPSMTNMKFDPEADCYAYDVEVGEGEEVFYTITAPKTGSYTIGSKEGNDYEIKFYQNDLSSYDNSLTISSDTNKGNNVQHMRIVTDGQLTFSVKSKSGTAGTVELLVCIPLPEPEMTIASAPDTFTLNFVEGVNEAIVRFDTEHLGSGIYELSVETEYELKVTEIAITGHTLQENVPLPYTREIKNSEVGGYTDYHIYILDEDVTYPTTVTFKITRTGDARTERTENINVSANVSTKFADQDGTFTWMPTNGSVTPYEKDGLWYVNIDGVEKPLVAAISKNLRVYESSEVDETTGEIIGGATFTEMYSFTTMEFYGENGFTPGEQQNSKLTLVTTETTATEVVTIKTIYNDFITAYANNSNTDGVYQVTNELKSFLEKFMEQSYFDFTGNKNKPDQPWLIACGYYA